MDPERTARYPFVSEAGRPPPVAIERTEGPWLIAADGRRIYDAAGGAIVSNIGHGRREVAEAAAAAMEEVTYVVPPFASPSRVRLVERLQDHWLPGDISRVVFTSGGSESMDAAIRLARQHHLSAGRPDRWKIISRELSYHGTTIGTLAIGGNTKRRAPFEPLLFDSPKAPNCYPLRCALCRGEGGCTLACADAIGDVILQAGPETVAAFVGEPIVGSTAGAIVPPDGYWPRVAEICRKYGILLIADEVMVGFGRTGRRFALDHWDVVPDVLVAGKGLGGGYMPIGGVYTREEVIAPIAAAGDELMFFTYSAHPAACAAADKVLEIIDREGLVERAAEMGERLRERLAPLQDHPNVAEVRGRGLFQAVEFVRDRESLEPFPADVRFAGRFVATALGNGVFFYPGGCDPARDVVCFGPPFTITMDEIDHIVGVFEKTLAEVLVSLEAA
ncbi:MAG: aminotransferase class III-fold pyridoxal phosphate-dependent enzyme [Myxococcales bacterium]|nr:aminotransferase class III-fold pyridoxal phosphate-dependent enzyme [Myxococcales bacterium]